MPSAAEAAVSLAEARRSWPWRSGGGGTRPEDTSRAHIRAGGRYRFSLRESRRTVDPGGTSGTGMLLQVSWRAAGVYNWHGVGTDRPRAARRYQGRHLARSPRNHSRPRPRSGTPWAERSHPLPGRNEGTSRCGEPREFARAHVSELGFNSAAHIGAGDPQEAGLLPSRCCG